MGSGWQNKMKALSGTTFDSPFYPCSIKKWCTLSEEMWNTVSVNEFKTIILKHNTNSLKLLTHLTLNFSHLNEYEFRHGFRDTVDPVCKCYLETEAPLNFLFRCSLYSCIRTGLLNDYIYCCFIVTNYFDETVLNILLYGPQDFSVKTSQ